MGTWSITGSPMGAEALIAPGIDFIAVDLQHGSLELADLRPVVTAIENRGAVALARVAVNDAAVIGRALDLGALGVIVPLVDDPDGAARAVAAARYFPDGIRSYGPNHFGLVHGTYAPADAASVAVVAMIETRHGLAQAQAIAATPGLDAILIGPADLALALGHDPDVAHETDEVIGAFMTVRDACRAAGIAAGIVCPTPALAARYLSAGFRLITLGSDLGLLAGGIHRLLADLETATG